MSSAQALVFSTPELLELILGYLPLSSLLTIRRTSSHLSNLIQTSPLLQQKLFFRAHTPLSSGSWHANPLLCQHFPPFFTAPPDRSKSSRSGHSFSIDKGLDWTQDAQKRSAFLRKEASWRSMSLVSHPSSSLRIVKYVHAMGGDSTSIARIPFHPSSGVTMGIVYDIVHDFLEYNSSASLCVAYQLNHATGDVEISLALYMTISCVLGGWAEESISLRSEGEEMTVRGLEWQRGKRREEDTDIPGRRDVWGTDLTEERGGVA